MSRRKRKWQQETYNPYPDLQQSRPQGNHSQTTDLGGFSRVPSLSPPQLVFSPLCFLKIQYLMHKGDHEVGGYGLASDPEKPLYLTDLLVPKQECSYAYVEFDTDDLQGMLMDVAAKGLPNPGVWVHTHPMSSAVPSFRDETTFDTMIGPWSVMAIFAKGGASSARLQVRESLKFGMDIPVQIDWGSLSSGGKALFPTTELRDEWEKTYHEKCTESSFGATIMGGCYNPSGWGGHALEGPKSEKLFTPDIDNMTPYEIDQLIEQMVDHSSKGD